MSKADKRLKRRIALAQARQVWQWSTCILILSVFPYLEVKDRLEREYVFENKAVSIEAVSDTRKPFPPQTVEEIIGSLFEDEARLAVAVAKAESRLDVRAKGWNCYYYSNGERYSAACKVEDRGKAWSVDCGLFQVNVIGQECPEHLYNPLENAKVAKDIRIKGGWSRWVAYNKGLHEQYL